MRLRGGEDGEDSSDIIQFYEQILEGNPTSATAHVSLGRVYERKNNFDAAESQYAIAKALNPLDPLCYSYLGQVLLNQRQRPEAAMEEFKQALALSPDAAELHHVMARINHGFGKYEEAKDGYKKTLELQPNDGQTMSDLGSLLEAEDGDQDTVFGLYKQATKFHPDSALVWSNYGRALLNKKKYRDAITSLRNALRIEPDSHHALCNLGAALASFAPDCTESEFMEDEEPRRRGREGMVEAEGGRTEEEEINEKERKEEGKEEGKCGSDKEEKENKEEEVMVCDVEDIYARALDLCPFDPSTLVNYGKVCMEKGRVKMAEELFEEALKLEPDMVEAISGLGSIIEHRMTDELDTKRKEQFLNIAEAHHEKALSLLPDNPDVITNYAVRRIGGTGRMKLRSCTSEVASLR
ncbi:hypothetical protein GUITHDRAFT_103468 [Guillardia theta CCMP2712]|uniref:Uncharacterized protein n=1 Tax=Guillardia theta (strain CCMP2712) TaxID=905079 RepID=L1JS32_GUITC|nr:hypothetical protein GUITHDRAFT_103468 [Guillardia theta CCMP2712]EKX50883.1 hypothetical protein GUITHDRAFT_103468 [Guillardia theta CCMP2712]|eukprot:XP_005837863.1 hypothetical protein GUITHDRAFT_103468 [Guillardia theta CCMP2712]